MGQSPASPWRGKTQSLSGPSPLPPWHRLGSQPDPLRDGPPLRCAMAAPTTDPVLARSVRDVAYVPTARKRQLLIATDVALARSAAGGCDAAALLTSWRWCDARVRALEAVMSLAEPSLDEMAHGDGEDAGRNADDAEEPTIWRLPLHLLKRSHSASASPVFLRAC